MLRQTGKIRTKNSVITIIMTKTSSITMAGLITDYLFNSDWSALNVEKKNKKQTNKFHGTVLYLISLNDPSDRVYLLVRTHYIQGTLWIHRILKLGKYHYNLRFKLTSTKNSGPGSLLMQVLQKKKA